MKSPLMPALRAAVPGADAAGAGFAAEALASGDAARQSSDGSVAMARAAVAAELRLVDADRDRGDGLAGGVEHRRAERIDAFAHRLVVDAVAALAASAPAP